MPYVIETYFQCIRLIRSEDSKSLQLLNFWLRDLVEAVVRGGSGSAVLPGSGSALLAGTGSAVLPWSGGRLCKDDLGYAAINVQNAVFQ